MRNQLLTMLLTLLLLSAVSFGVASVPRRDNGLGVIIEYSNPLIYNMGLIVDGTVIRDKDKVAVNLRVQPYGTFELYTEQVLLCGPPTDELKHASGPVVLVYKKVAHQTVSGVACHDFEGVFHIQAEEK